MKMFYFVELNKCLEVNFSKQNGRQSVGIIVSFLDNLYVEPITLDEKF